MATITLTITHPQLSKTHTLTVADARLVEFIDNLRTYVYPQLALTRVQTVDVIVANVDNSIRDLYKQALNAANAAALPPPGEIDA